MEETPTINNQNILLFEDFINKNDPSAFEPLSPKYHNHFHKSCDKIKCNQYIDIGSNTTRSYRIYKNEKRIYFFTFYMEDIESYSII